MNFMVLLVTSLVFVSFGCKLTENEAKAVSAVAKKLKVSFATLLDSSASLKTLQIFSANGIFVNYKTGEDVKKMALESTPGDNPTMIILRATDSKSIFPMEFDLRYILARENEPYSQKHFQEKHNRDSWIWLEIYQQNDTFPTAQKQLFGIPYDVQPIPNGYNIWERYDMIRIGPFSYRTNYDPIRTFIARWYPKTGLKIYSDAFHYSPRNIFIRRSWKNRLVLLAHCYGKRIQEIGESSVHRIGDEILQVLKEIIGFRDVFDMFIYPRNNCHLTIPIQSKNQPGIWEYLLGPIAKFQVYLYYKEPELKPLENYVLQPFEPNLWAVLTAWILIATVCAKIAQMGRKISTVECFFQVFESFCSQGDGPQGDSTVIRLITAAIWVTVIVITAAYSAIIFKFIIIRNPTVPFATLDEFFKDGTYKYTGFYTNQDWYQALAANYQPRFTHQLSTTQDDATIETICKNPKLAMTAPRIEIETNPYKPCRLARMPEAYIETDIGFRVLSYTSVAQTCKEKLPLLHSVGIVKFIKKRYIDPPEMTDEPDEITPPPDGNLLKHVLIIVPTACFISIIIFYVETIIKPHQQTNH